MGECRQQKHTQHAPSLKTECDYLNGWIEKWSHTQKSHPKVVNSRDIAGERTKKKKKKYTWCHFMSILCMECLVYFRYYWLEDDNLYQRAVNAQFPYAYEYLGNTGRLVITPLTDRSVSGSFMCNHSPSIKGYGKTSHFLVVSCIASRKCVRLWDFLTDVSVDVTHSSIAFGRSCYTVVVCHLAFICLAFYAGCSGHIKIVWV